MAGGEKKNVMYLVPGDVVESWRGQIRMDAADNPSTNYVRRAEAGMRHVLNDDSTSSREQVAEASRRLSEYLTAKKLRDAPVPGPRAPPPVANVLPPEPVIPPHVRFQAAAPPPPPQAAAVAVAPPPQAAAAPPQAAAVAVAEADPDVELIDRTQLQDVRRSYQRNALELLRTMRDTNRDPGVEYGDRLGDVRVDGQPIPGLAALLNDALYQRRKIARAADSPGYGAFRRALGGADIPRGLVNRFYRGPRLRELDDETGLAVGEPLDHWARLPATPIKQPAPPRLALKGWATPPSDLARVRARGSRIPRWKRF